MTTYHRFFARSAASVAVCVVLLYAAEFVIGGYLGERPGHFPVEMFVPDKARGTALTPGFDGQVKRVRRFRVTVNQRGYRDASWTAKLQPRVLLVGSSAAFGVGLEREEGIAARLEAELAGSASVMNAGVYSYGPPQILATIKRECPVWHPRLVLYLHEYKMTRRDFVAPYRSNPGTPNFDPPRSSFSFSLQSIRGYLSNRGLHPRQILERAWGLERLGEQYLLEHYAQTRPSENYCSDCAMRAGAAIQKMWHTAEACGAKFLMVVLPGPAEAYYGLREPATQAVLATLKAVAPAFPVYDLRSMVARGERMNIPGLDYFNRETAAWIAKQLVPPVSNTLAMSARRTPVNN